MIQRKDRKNQKHLLQVDNRYKKNRLYYLCIVDKLMS